MGAQLVFDALQHAGLTLYLLDGGILRASPPEAVTPEARAMIRGHKAALVALLKNGGGNPSTTPPPSEPSDSLLDGTQAALIGDGVPVEWIEGLAQLKAVQRPRDIPPKKWRSVIDAAATFSDRWAVKAYELGWTTAEVFGIHHAKPLVRVDVMGLLLAMSGHGVHLVELTQDTAIFEAGPTRARQTMKKSMVFTNEHELLWNLK